MYRESTLTLHYIKRVAEVFHSTHVGHGGLSFVDLEIQGPLYISGYGFPYPPCSPFGLAEDQRDVGA